MKEYGIRGLLATGFSMFIYCWIYLLWPEDANKAVFSLAFVYGWDASKRWLYDARNTKNIK